MTDEPLQQKLTHQKQFILIGLAVAMLGIVLLIINNMNRVVCDNSTFDNHNHRWQLEITNPSNIENPTQRLVIDSKTVSRIERLAIMKVAIKAYPNYFTLHFSPDSSMLALSELGFDDWNESFVFVWRLDQPQVCILQVGDGTFSHPSSQHFVAFSSDSRRILTIQCAIFVEIPINQDMECIAQWNVNDNRLIDRYFEARLIEENNDLQLEYRRESNAPAEKALGLWQNPLQNDARINVQITGSELQLIDVQSGKTIWKTQASQNILDARISPDGKLLAFALNNSQIELWGIKNPSPYSQ